MPKSPFQPLGTPGGSGIQNVTGAPLQISQSTNTVRTPGIGTLSVDLTGQKGVQQDETGKMQGILGLPGAIGEFVGGTVKGAYEIPGHLADAAQQIQKQGAGVIPGMLGDVVGEGLKGAGTVLGAAGQIPGIGGAFDATMWALNQGSNALFPIFRGGAIRNYMGEPQSPLDKGLGELSDFIVPFLDPLGEQGAKSRAEYNRWFADPSVDLASKLASVPARLALQTAGLYFSMRGGAALSKLPAVGPAVGKGIAALGTRLGPTIGRVPGIATKLAGPAAFGSFFSDDPSSLPEEAKRIIDNGGTFEQALDYMKENYKWVGDDGLRNLAVGLVFDPINQVGSTWNFARNIGESHNLVTLMNDGRTFDEFLAAGTMGKKELAVAKRVGFIGKSYNAATSLVTKNRFAEKLKIVARPSVAEALTGGLGADLLNEVSELSVKVGGSAVENLPKALNRTMNFQVTDALKSPLTRNMADGARNFAENVISVAGREGLEGLKGIPELRGSSDEFLNSIITKAERYKTTFGDDSIKALEDLTESLRTQKNVQLLNSEMGGAFMRSAARAPFIGRVFRNEVIYAARKSLFRSLQRWENSVAKALEGGAEGNASLRSEFMDRMNVVMDTAKNGNADAVEQFFNKKYSESLALWQAGKKEAAVQSMAKVMEVSRMGSFAKAIEIVQPVRRITGQKVTPVLESRFSREDLVDAITSLKNAVDTENPEIVAKVAEELISKNQDLAFKYDSVTLSARLKDDAVAIGKDMLAYLNRLERDGAYVSRLPKTLSDKLDAFEFGKKTGGEEFAVEGEAFKQSFKNTLSSVFNSNPWQVGEKPMLKTDDIIPVFTDEITSDVLSQRAAAGEDISKWSHLSGSEELAPNYSLAAQGEQANRMRAKFRLLTEKIKQTVADGGFGVNAGANIFKRRDLFETFHYGIKELDDVNLTKAGLSDAGFIGDYTYARNIIADDGLLSDVANSYVKEGDVHTTISQGSTDAIGPDPEWGNRLSSSENDIKEYDGLYTRPGSSDGKYEYVFKKSLLGVLPERITGELIWNRMWKAVTRANPAHSPWYAPTVRIEKVNPEVAMKEHFGFKFYKDKPTFGGMIQDLGMMHLHDESATVSELAGATDQSKIFIPGATKEGVTKLLAYGPDQRAKIFLDPTRLGLGFLLEGSPRRAVPNLDRIFVSVAPDGQTIGQITDLVGDIRNSAQIGDWFGNKSMDDWLAEYLVSTVNTSTDVAVEANRTVFDMMFGDPRLKFTPDQKPDIAATVEAILYGESAALDGATVGGEIQKVMAEVHALRKKEIAKDTVNLTPYKTMAQKTDGDRFTYSWADLFHNLDSRHEYANVNYKDSSFVKPKFGQVGTHAKRPFTFISGLDSIDPSWGSISNMELLGIDKMDPSSVNKLNTVAANHFIHNTEFMDQALYKSYMATTGGIHRFVDRLGGFVDERLARSLGSGPGQKTTQHLRIYDPAGNPLIEPRFTSPFNAKQGTTVSVNHKVDFATPSFNYAANFFAPGTTDPYRLNSIADAMDGVNPDWADAAIVAKQSEIEVDNTKPMTPEEAAAELKTPGAKATKEAEAAAEEQKNLEELVKARAQLRELGYEMGLEPAAGYTESMDIMRDLKGNAVIRPRFDLYTSIDEVTDMTEFGVKADNVLPVRKNTLMEKYRKAVLPIHNNELYDNAVERLRYYLGNKISTEESLRSMANIVQRAISKEINPGGLGNEEIAAVFVESFGGGERGARTYSKVFGAAGGNASPRAALMYALEGRPEIIGLTTNFSKRLQAKSETLAMLANKLYPLMRYRYNPYFNWQEGIEPYAFNLLRGVYGQKDYEEGAMLSRTLSSDGGAMMDNHNVGAHVLLRNASVLQRMSQKVQGIDEVVHQRMLSRFLEKGKKAAQYIGGVSEEMRAGVGASKSAAIAAGTKNELIRAVAPEMVAEIPMLRKELFELTGSNDPSTWMKYYMDQANSGFIPTDVLRIGDVATSRFTYGTPIQIQDLGPIKEAISNPNITPELVDSIEDISSILERVGGPLELRVELAGKLRAWVSSVKKIRSTENQLTKTGNFAGKLAVTTADNITPKTQKAVNKWVSSWYSKLSPYLGAKAEFGVQLNNLTRNEKKMVQYAESLGGYNSKELGDARFTEIDQVVNELDSAIQNNRIQLNTRLFRGTGLDDFLRDTDIGEIKPGFTFGMENISAWSRNLQTARGFAKGDSPVILVIDNAKGLPGFDLNAAGASHMPGEAEVLLPRGTKYKVIENLGEYQGKMMLKVRLELQPQYQQAFERLSADDAKRVAVEKAIDNIEILQADIVAQAKITELAFRKYPSILNEVQRMGLRLGEEPAAIPSVRLRRKTIPISPVNMPDPNANLLVDRYRSVQSFNLPDAPPTLDRAVAFGTKEKGPLASLNVEGNTGVWMGLDGKRRYLKRVTNMDKNFHASVNEYIVNRLYKRMGVAVPEPSIVVDGTDIYHASEWVEGIKTLGEVPVTREMARDFSDNFVADLMLANYDAVGPDFANVGIIPDGTIVRIDVGASLKFKASGEMKTAANQWLDVNPAYWWQEGIKSPAQSFKALMLKAHPELDDQATMLGLDTFVQQYDEMSAMLGDYRQFIDEIVEGLRPQLVATGHYTPEKLGMYIDDMKEVLDTRIRQIGTYVDTLRAEKAALAGMGDAIPTELAAKTPKIKLKKQDKWVREISTRLAAAQAEGVRAPGWEEFLQGVAAGKQFTAQEIAAVGAGLAPYLYQRGAMKSMLDFFRTGHAVATKRIFQEQMFSQSKGMLERTLNHPILGPYPTSYMYGKVLPAFINALFKYAPFTGEFAPFVGARRLNLIGEYIASSIEQNEELYDYVMRRPPLIMFLSGLLPGWPSDVGLSLPYWFREGIMRPIAEGKPESIPGNLAAAAGETLARQFGPAQSVKKVVDSVSDIQNYLTGSNQTSVLDVIGDYLHDSN